MLELTPKPSLILPFALIACYCIYTLLIRKRPATLPDLPWINADGPGQWSKVISTLRNTKDFRKAVEDAYQNYSKSERACIVSTIENTVVVLPASTADWIIGQPDNKLSAIDSQREGLQFDRTFPDPILAQNPTHVHTINTGLTRQLGNLTTDIMDELTYGLDEAWGKDSSEWKSIPNVFENIMGVVARTTNRTFVGLPLCRNKELLGAAAGFAVAVPFSSNMLNLAPKCLQPLVATIVTIPNKLYFRTFRKIVEPEIKRRFAEYDRRTADPEKKALESEPNDFLQWHVNYAKKAEVRSEFNPRIVAGRILMLNFAAIHTTTFSVTNILFDLVASDPQLRLIEQLREEIETVLAEEGGKWTKQGVRKLVKMDSTLRESQRMNSFLGIGLNRKVVAPEGITTPQGVHCPYGSTIGVPTYGTHYDPTIYPQADQFKPFRFADLREGVDDDASGLIKKVSYGFVTTSADYLPFGHGRHACPGRFFAANEIKLMLAYMFMNYDFEPLPIRPPSSWFGTVLVPPMKTPIRVRRKQSGLGS